MIPALQKKVAEGMGLQELAREVGIDVSTIYKYRRQLISTEGDGGGY
jgi:DNA-binding CsgD family transcriptional regulator